VAAGRDDRAFRGPEHLESESSKRGRTHGALQDRLSATTSRRWSLEISGTFRPSIVQLPRTDVSLAATSSSGRASQASWPETTVPSRTLGPQVLPGLRTLLADNPTDRSYSRQTVPLQTPAGHLIVEGHHEPALDRGRCFAGQLLVDDGPNEGLEVGLLGFCWKRGRPASATSRAMTASWDARIRAASASETRLGDLVSASLS